MNAGSARHLLIDGRHIDGKATGLSRFSEELTHAIADIEAIQLTVVSNREITPRVPLPGHVNQLVDSSVWAKLPGSLWLNARVPAIAQELGVTHLLGMLHMLPCTKPVGMHYGLLMHDLVYLFFPETMATTNRWLSRILVPRSLRVADSIFAVSKTTLTDIETHYPHLKAGVKVAYPGTTFVPPNLTARPQSGPVRLLFVGSREPRKNLLPLLLAFDLACSKGFDGELNLVSGAQWGDDRLTDVINRHRGQRIKVHERISDVELIQMYDLADFLVMPSLYEGLGLPILEAVGRCAVIANDIQVFRELGQHIDGITYWRFNEDASSLDMLANQIMTLAPASPACFRTEATQQLFTWRACARSIVGTLLV